MVAHSAALKRRLGAVWSQRRHDPRARPEGADVVGGAIAVGAVLAEAGNAGIDQPWIACCEIFVVESGTLERRYSRIGHEDVGLGGEIGDNGGTLRF